MHEPSITEFYELVFHNDINQQMMSLWLTVELEIYKIYHVSVEASVPLCSSACSGWVSLQGPVEESSPYAVSSQSLSTGAVKSS